MDDLWRWALAVPWIGAAMLAALPRRWDRRANDVALVFASTTTAIVTAALQEPGTATMRDVLREAWIQPIGLELHFVRDGLSDLFGILVVWIALLVIAFARHYLPAANRHEGAQRRESAFYALMLGFVGSMLATISSGNWIQLYFGWELTSVASYLLIAYWRQIDEARRGALRSFAMTSIGGLALLAGLVCLGSSHGWSIDASLEQGPLHGPSAELCTALVLLGALAKSAQFPFSNWLPQAMLAPTPVSAFLHSSALVALGPFLLARTFPLLHATQAWGWILSTAGVVGVVFGGLVAARQLKIKSLLAWSTVSMYAYMILGFSLGTATGLFAALYAFFVHAYIKAGLFLLAGSVTYLTGKKTLDQVAGVGKTHPALAVYGIVLGLSLGGVPLTGGFYFKEELLHAAQEEGAWLLLGAMFMGGLLSIIYMLRFLHEIFVGPVEHSKLGPFPRSMGIPIACVSFLAVLTGFLPNWMAPLGLNASLAELLPGEVPPVDIELNPLFFTSVLIVTIGAALWLSWRRRWIPHHWWLRIPEALPLGGRWWERRYAEFATACLRTHSGDLRRYLLRQLLIFLVVAALVSVMTWPAAAVPMPLDWFAPSPALTLITVCVILIALANLLSRSYVTFVLTLTLLGFALGALFIVLHAPNVALAQILIEMLATLCVLLAVRQSGRVHPLESTFGSDARRPVAFVRIGTALTFGIVASVGSWMAMSASPSARVGDWYAANIHERTGANDFVAAVLTDFRGLDTLLEVFVFVIAVLGVRSLRASFRAGGSS